MGEITTVGIDLAKEVFAVCVRGGRGAVAIAVAARQPTMRFVALKSVEQQAILSWHRLRQGWIEERTALLNRIRGLLAEFGVLSARGSAALLKALPVLSVQTDVPDAIRAPNTAAVRISPNAEAEPGREACRRPSTRARG